MLIRPIKDPGKIRVGLAQILYTYSFGVEDWECDFLREVDDPHYLLGNNNSLEAAKGKHDSAAISELQDIIEENYYEWFSDKLRRIIHAADREGVDLLIFPELSIPARCLRIVRDLATRLGLVIVAGSHYVRGIDLELYRNIRLTEVAEDYRNRNLCPVFLPDGSVRHIDKRKRSSHPYDWERMREGNGPQLVSCALNDRQYNMGVCICNEYLALEDEYNKISKHADFFVVLACTRKTEPFETVAKKQLFHPNNKLTIFVNDAQFGGTTAYAKFDVKRQPRLEQYRVRPLPSNEECLLIVDVDPCNQRLDLEGAYTDEHLPTKVYLEMPLIYNQELFVTVPFGKKTPYTAFFETSAADLSYARTTLNSVLTEDSILNLSSSLLRDRLRSLVTDPDRMANLDDWGIYKHLAVVGFPLEVPNLYEWRYIQMFGLGMYLHEASVRELLQLVVDRQQALQTEYRRHIRQSIAHRFDLGNVVGYSKASRQYFGQTKTDSEIANTLADVQEKLGLRSSLEAFASLYHNIDAQTSIIGIEPLKVTARREFQPSDVVRKLEKLVDSISRANYDYIAATSGKALWLLRLAPLPKSIWPRLVLADKLEYVAEGELRGKQVLVFQDSVRTGATLATLIEQVSKKGATTVDTCALLVHYSCQPDLIPRWHVPELIGLLDDDYELIKQDLQELVRTRVLPLEADRVIFKVSYEGEILPMLFDSLTQFGQVVYITEGAFSEDGVTFLDLLKTVFSSQVAAPSWLGQEREERIRIYIMEGASTAYFAPIVSYYTPVALRLPSIDCVGSERWSMPFCTLRQDCAGFQSPSRCSDCSMLNISLELGSLFMKALVRDLIAKGAKIRQLSYNSTELQACYHAIRQELLNVVNQRCRDIIETAKRSQIG